MKAGHLTGIPASEAYNLAMYAAITLKDTMKPLLAKAHAEARAVAKQANILTSENVGEKLAQAEAEMAAVKEAAHLE